jgi:glucan biosynthesis protein C
LHGKGKKMHEVGNRKNATVNAQPAGGVSSRLPFLDHLRAALVILVVLHHAALVYGAGAPFYYTEPPLSDPLAYLILLVFVLFNQAWFMGAFFLLAGYFTPGSFDRKGPGGFLKSRLVRLGIPLLLFYFVLNPLSSIGYWQMPAELTGITTPLTWQAYPRLLGMGPLWFAAMLLVFDFGYAARRMLARNRKPPAAEGSTAPGYLAIGAFILALAMAGFLMRAVIPMGEYVLGFPTLSYLPQYLALFAAGAAASRRGWLRNPPGSLGAAGLASAAVASILLFPLALSGKLFSLQPAEPAQFVGNGSWSSALYALWDSIFAVGMILGAAVVFRRFFNREGSFGRFLARHGYAVFLLHVPIVVFIGIALKGIQIEPLLKFGLASAIALPLCFAAACAVRKIPGVSRIL